MQLYNGATASLALAPPPPPGGLNLPLWVVIGRTDLHDLFRRFASQVYESADIANTKLDFDFPRLDGQGNHLPLPSGLCRMIYYGWLKEFITSTTAFNSAGNKVTSSTYNNAVGTVSLPIVSDSASLISMLKAVLVARKACRLYMLVGIYHFVIWCLSTNLDSAGRIDTVVVDYVKQELVKHFYHDRDVNDDVVWINPVSYPTDFADNFKPDNSLKTFEGGMKSIRDHLEFDTAKRPLSDFNTFHDDYKYASRAAVCSFIKRARQLLTETVHEETRAVLEAIDPELMADYTCAKVLALGGGEETYGYFGLRTFGILFFDYELACARSKEPFHAASSVDYLGIQTSAAYEISGKDASSVFITHIGMDQNFKSAFSSATSRASVNTYIPYVETQILGVSAQLQSRETLYAVYNGWSRLEHGAGSGMYNPSDSCISIGGAECSHLYFSTNRPSPPSTPQTQKKQQEEIGFFVMANKVLPPPPDAIASTFWLLPDNEFYDATAVAGLFQGNPSDLNDLDDVIDELLLAGKFEINASLKGEGIGYILDAAEALSSWQAIAKAPSQSDLPKFKTKPADNDQERHARGTVSVFHNGDHHLLRFDVIGFASPVRCTWKTKYPFYNKMKLQIGDHVVKRDQDAQGGPWYNGALSSFRAFGLLKGIIEALNARISTRKQTSPPSLIAALDSIANKLSAFLGTEAAVGIKTRTEEWVKKNGTDLIIDNAVFLDVTTP